MKFVKSGRNPLKKMEKKLNIIKNIQEFMVKFMELALMAISEKSYIVVP
ncbi:Uncharacterised protein [Neisseria meningitidis]|nr:hypothetical protein NMNM586_0059 [Neisseria meningitidis NM586]RQK78071.1 hypothetical protein COH54_11825 [Neisseria meningitidis]RQK90067.1 hypothetical protein COH47_11340 [Neisseria meningitidis]CWM77909.1 Uncharacterised protein [Neisseria meningitidis]CWR20550.1 Uncharacterised protein [Neisseria meningitidis]